MDMNTTSASRILAFLLWGIVLISCICMESASGRINGCSGECETDAVEIVRSYPAEHSFHRIDLFKPNPVGFAEAWDTLSR